MRERERERERERDTHVRFHVKLQQHFVPLTVVCRGLNAAIKHLMYNNNNNQKKEYSEILSLIWKIPNTDECRRIQIISLSAGVKQWSVFIFCSPTYTLHHHFFKLQFFSILFMNVCIYISLCSPLSLLAVCCIQLQIIRQLIGGGGNLCTPSQILL